MAFQDNLDEFEKNCVSVGPDFILFSLRVTFLLQIHIASHFSIICIQTRLKSLDLVVFARYC